MRLGVLRTDGSRDGDLSDSLDEWTLYVTLLRVEPSSRSEDVALGVAGLEGDNVGCQIADGPTPTITRIR